ncbi:MAG: carbohydrate ABC transporter permease [Blautia faecis]
MALPNELEDAARIDGCNHFMIFSRIMFPLVKPGLVALAILTLRSAWNDLMWPMIVNTSPEKNDPFSRIILSSGTVCTDYPVMMAGAVLAVLPLLILFALFQKQFIEGIALQGIKG